ncbi:excitatory amino acid transporter 3 isoform X1 [Bombus vancouverensis nearcticus]|uniref:excitatory amino acid transporter 3 isoform X1 n=3 Tax=Bombus vancouverensis nearcticus TaxID=2705178 RepID=UPI0014389D8D|nr:excitatory amino acid transporter 3-like isoform X1 [Bombus vancouverensis nearcticus]
MNILKEILRQKIILWTVIGVCAGISLGLILKTFTLQPWTKRNVMYLKFPGELFMRIVNCLILPLITSSIVSATCNLKKSGRIGTMALYYYTTTTSLGIILSVILVQTIRPGDLLKDKNIITQNTTRYSITVDTILDLFRNFIPENIVSATLFQYQTVLQKNESVPIDEWKIDHMNVPGTDVLGLVVFSLVLGLAIGDIGAKGEPLINFFLSLSDAMMKIMSWAIMLVPISALFLISAKILEVEDFNSLIKRLGIYILTVFSGLLIQGLILLPLVYFICTRQSPYNIIVKLGPAFATAFGTSSSTATVPVTISCLERIGIPSKISNFIVPIGATINMDGIALYESIGAIFIIQLHGLQFSLFRIIIICITCTLSCIGAAGLPSGGYVMLIMVLNSVGVPVEDVSLIIAIDWFVDRFRTTLNIIADALGAGIISHHYKKSKQNSIPEEIGLYTSA